MSLAWNCEKDDAAWMEAKRRLGVADVRDLSTEDFRRVIALAQKIKTEAK